MDNTNNLDKPKKLDLESTNTKDLKYPRSVCFIVGNEFCERFCYYGMKAVLVLYFTKVLRLTDDEATESYHEFVLLCYFTPLIGAILADSYLGKFKTILYLSILYAVGNIALSAASYFEHSLLSIFSLGLIAFGTGGIKPCVSAFGGDQFVAGQEDQLNKFFAIFYMSINLGSLVSTFITPILRSDVSCSSRGDCFPLAFGVPAILMTVALLLFIAGKPFYRIVAVAKGNIIFKFFQCNAYAIGVKLQSLYTSKKGLEKRDHWLDYAEDKFSPKLIQDVKTVNRVLFLYLPLPLFWALFDQQGSRWTLQALKMDGIVFGETALKPDQLQVINPVLIVGMIPVFSYIVYPITNKIGIFKTPLQRMTIGGLLAGASFIVAAFLQISLESEVPKGPSPGYGAITLINSLPCAITLLSANSAFPKTFSLDPGSAIRAPNDLPVGLYPITVQSQGTCYLGNDTSIELATFNIKIDDQEINAIHLIPKKSASTISPIYSLAVKIYPHSLVKPDKGDAAVQLAYSLPLSMKDGENTSQSIYLSKSLNEASNDPNFNFNYSTGLTDYLKIETFSGIEKYNVLLKNIAEADYSIKVRNGASYILVVNQDPISGQVNYKLNKVVNENHVSMLWQIPQYFVITCGEIMFSITGLEFSYSQAPTSMKSVVSAAWLLTVSFGNLLVAIITKYIKFNKQSIEFFFFAGLMICDMIIFAFIACLYTYSNQALEDGNSDSPGNGTVKSNGQGVTVTSSSHPPSSSSSVESPHTKHDSPVDRMRTQSGSNELQDTKL